MFVMIYKTEIIRMGLGWFDNEIEEENSKTFSDVERGNGFHYLTWTST